MSRNQQVIVAPAKAGVQSDPSVDSTACCRSEASGLALALDSRFRGNDDGNQDVEKTSLQFRPTSQADWFVDAIDMPPSW